MAWAQCSLRFNGGPPPPGGGLKLAEKVVWGLTRHSLTVIPTLACARICNLISLKRVFALGLSPTWDFVVCFPSGSLHPTKKLQKPHRLLQAWQSFLILREVSSCRFLMFVVNA